MRNCALVAVGEAARRLGVSPTTVQRWVDRGLLTGHRTSGGHRRIALDDVQRLMEQVRPVDKTRENAAWFEVLLSGDSAAVFSALKASREGAGNWAKTADVVASVVAELGQLWEIGRCAVYEEHIATEALRRAAAHCAMAHVAAEDAPTALLLTVEGERHTLGLSLAELVLQELGWRALWIGEGPPIQELLPMIRNLKPNLIVLFATEILPRRAVLAYEEALHETASDSSSIVVAAGRAAWTTTRPEHRVQNFTSFGGLVGRLIGDLAVEKPR